MDAIYIVSVITIFLAENSFQSYFENKCNSESSADCLTMANTSTSYDIGKCTGQCDSLPAFCYTCDEIKCVYGEEFSRNCAVQDNVKCTGERKVQKTFQCRYCFLTIANVEHKCKQINTSCNVVANPKQRVKASCAVGDFVFCLGSRTFSKMVDCNWTSGYKWVIALTLSVTLGGFGIDRFYLGYWREGLGKLFSFGGLGVWTMIDITLIATSSLQPADGSLYIYS